jgi:hypothetical protein
MFFDPIVYACETDTRLTIFYLIVAVIQTNIVAMSVMTFLVTTCPTRSIFI